MRRLRVAAKRPAAARSNAEPGSGIELKSTNPSAPAPAASRSALSFPVPQPGGVRPVSVPAAETVAASIPVAERAKAPRAEKKRSFFIESVGHLEV